MQHWGQAFVGWLQINVTLTLLIALAAGAIGLWAWLGELVGGWWPARGRPADSQPTIQDVGQPAIAAGESASAPVADPIPGYCPAVPRHDITYDEAGHCWRCCGERFPTLVAVEQHAGKATGRPWANRRERIEMTALTDDPEVALELLQQHVRKAIP